MQGTHAYGCWIEYEPGEGSAVVDDTGVGYESGVKIHVDLKNAHLLWKRGKAGGRHSL